MRYYYFNPFNKQYYFPKNFGRYPFLLSFYQPYTLNGRILWTIWLTFPLIKYFFSTTKAEKILPINQLQQHLPANSIIAFNRGTRGEEQKTTILGFNPQTKKEFFIKYAESPMAQANVKNEGIILSQLKHLDFVPQLQLQVSEKGYTFIQTNTLKGERLSNQTLENNELIQVLIQIGKQKVATDRTYSTVLETCFAHGDFCPWNMMKTRGKLKVFDWEMAGIYPVGYDLFTYLFQTSFLLTPNVNIETILKQQEELITKVFMAFEIEYWQPYLLSFANVKFELEAKKKDKKLVAFYQNLKSYAEKI